MSRDREHDGEGIIGDRPKPKSETEGLGLFSFVIDEAETISEKEERIIFGDPEANDAPAGPPIIVDEPAENILEGGENYEDEESSGFPGEENDCGSCGRVFTKGEPKWVAEPSIGAVCADCAEKIRAQSDDDAQPPPPSKPAPPTREEREAAIARIKSEILDDLVNDVAYTRIGLPRDQAGVTAEDARELAESLPVAALLGQAPRAWSWLGPWLASSARRGALVAWRISGLAVTRRSTRDKAHGNAHAVYLHPQDPRALTDT